MKGILAVIITALGTFQGIGAGGTVHYFVHDISRVKKLTFEKPRNEIFIVREIKFASRQVIIRFANSNFSTNTNLIGVITQDLARTAVHYVYYAGPDSGRGPPS